MRRIIPALLLLSVACFGGNDDGQPEANDDDTTTTLPDDDDDTLPQPECGNGMLEPGEACEGIRECEANGYVGQQYCRPGCTGWGSCVADTYCGDAIVNGPELCDSPPRPCVTGPYAGLETCLPDCTGYGECNAIESCGDGIVNGGELCDDNYGHCKKEGYSGYQPCLSDCAGYGECTITGYCGDGVQNGPEDCDGEGIQSCRINWYAGTRLCHADCTADPCVATEYCGDGVLQQVEDCELGGHESGTECGADCKVQVRWTGMVGSRTVGMADNGQGKLHVIDYDGSFESLSTDTGASLLKATNAFHFTTSLLQLPGGLLVAGTEEGRSLVLQPLAGLPLQSPLHDAAILAPPVLLEGGDYLIVTVSGGLSSVSSQTATTAWSVQTGQYSYARPAVDGAGNIYVARYGISPLSREWESIVASYKSGDGSLRWEKPVSVGSRLSIVSGLALSGSRLIIASYDKVLSVETANGSTVWELPKGGDLPVIDDRGRLYVSGPDGITCIESDTGSLVWEQSLPVFDGWPALGLTLGRTPKGDVLILGFIPVFVWTDWDLVLITSGPNSLIVALDTQDGRLAWKKEIHSLLSTGPLLTPDGAVYVAGQDANITALDSQGAVPCTTCAWPTQQHVWAPRNESWLFHY